MSKSPYVTIRTLCFAATAGLASAQMSVEQAVVTFETQINQFNVLTGQNMILTNTHTDGAIATRGDFTVNSSSVLSMNGATLQDLPSVYVAGNLYLGGHNNQLNTGSVYAPNYAATTSWSQPNASQRSLVSSGGSLRLDNSDTTLAGLTTAPTSSWDIDTAYSSLSQASIALSLAEATGTISASSNNLVLNTSVTSGVAVFNLDASTFGSTSGLNVQIPVPDDLLYVINVFNADDTTLFAGSNGNASGDSAERILWNIVPYSNPTTSSTVNFGANFYGSILAPLMDINVSNRYVNGQIVANNYSHSGAEVHHVKFDASSISFSAVPEPSSWGLMAFAMAGVGLTFQRNRHRRVQR